MPVLSSYIPIRNQRSICLSIPLRSRIRNTFLRAASFLRDVVARDVLALRHVPGRVMIADLLTKAVARVIFVDLIRLINEYPQTGIVVVASAPDADA